MKVSLIAAMTADKVIGIRNRLPWPHQSDDMKHFVASTTGKAVIMGKNTWDSLPETARPLKNRLNIVIVREAEHITVTESGEVWFVRSMERAIAIANEHNKDAVVIGGAKTYLDAMPFVTEMNITTIAGEYEGDCYFPSIDWEEWEEAESFDLTSNKVTIYAKVA